jgi:branched-chain amino acid transport system substrate-binding protein
MERYKNGVPTYIHAGAYSATLHYLNAVKAAGTDDGSAVAAKMHQLPLNDFFSRNVKVREDGQVMRPVYAVQVKKPSELKGTYDFYKILAEIPPDQAWRPASDSACELLKGK